MCGVRACACVCACACTCTCVHVLRMCMHVCCTPCYILKTNLLGGNTTATIVQVRRPGLRAGLGGGGRHGKRFTLGSQPSSVTNLLGHLG